MFAIVTVFAAALVDLFRSRRSLLTEIALLRHQLTVLERSVARPHVTRLDRITGGTRCHHANVDECAAGGPTRDASPLAPRRLQGSLALALPARADVAHRRRDRGADPHDGARKRALGGRADSRRIAQARDQSQQALPTHRCSRPSWSRMPHSRSTRVRRTDCALPTNNA